MVSTESAPAREVTSGATRLGGWTLTRWLVSRRGLRLLMLSLAAALLIGSIFLPYWGITLRAPQYPRGLKIEAYVSRLTGDVREVDGLNHYIGMMPLNDAARIERQISRYALVVVAILTVASFWFRGRWKWLVILPIVLFPVIFTADLFAWLYYAGHSLDPRAPLSSSIKPFTPQILGVGEIGQFSTLARFEAGFYLAVLAAALAIVATFLARKSEHANP